MPTHSPSRPGRRKTAHISSALPDVKLHGETRPLEDREARIARAAYRRAEERGFYPGHEIDDWLAAEKEIAESEGNGPPDAGSVDSNR